jgi:predicted N-acyltransferase
MLTVRIHRSLAETSDAALDRVTQDSSVFFDRGWLRMLDGLDLSPLCRGEVELRWALAERDGQLVGVCPFMVTRSSSVYFFYSLEKFFFTPWWREGAKELGPETDRLATWLSRFVNVYRRLARAARGGIEGWVLAVSPLSQRGDVALAPMTPREEHEVRGAVVAALKDVARAEDLPLCFCGVPEERASLRWSLAESGLDEVFLGYDNLLEIGADSFDGWMGRFKSEARRLFTREAKQARAAGIRFETTQQLGALGDHLARLYENTSSRYGDDHCHHPAGFWAALQQHVGSRAEAVVAYQQDRPVGFSLLLEKQGDVWFHRVGRAYEGPAAAAPTYFSLAFYEPIKRSLERGAKRIWLGFGSWEAKRRRGSIGHPLYSYFWFPRPWARAVVLPYLKLFGKVSREKMAWLTEPTNYLRADERVPTPGQVTPFPAPASAPASGHETKAA